MIPLAEEALDQINSKQCAIPYQADHRKVVKIGVNFDSAHVLLGGSGRIEIRCKKTMVPCLGRDRWHDTIYLPIELLENNRHRSTYPNLWLLQIEDISNRGSNVELHHAYIVELNTFFNVLS